MYGWSSQSGDGVYRLQVETDNVLQAAMTEKFAELMVDSANGTRRVKYAHWIYGKDGIPRCSACGEEDALSRSEWEERGGKVRDNESAFCPHCGAQMIGEVNHA